MIAPALAQLLGYTTGAKLLKAVATGYNPAFALANIPRDLSLYWMNTKAWSSFLPKALGQMGKDLVTVSRDAITKSGRYKQYINEGGGMELLTYQGRFGGSGEKNLLSRALGYIGETSEILTRLALRERAIINGASPEKATWMARRALDFAQGGSMTKAVDTCIPYLNAGVQATRTLVRAAVLDPKRFAWQASQLMAGASGLYYANGTINPKGYDQVSDREKEANWIIMMPPSMDYRDDKGQNRSVYFKVAKDQAQRVFTTGMEMILDRFHKGKVPTDQALAAVKDFIPTPASGQMLPPFLSAWFTYVFNKDFYRNQDVWKGPSGIEPKEEYTKDTPDLWRGVGEQTGLSPERARGSVQRVVPFGNPFVGLVGKLAQLATGSEVGDEISKKVGIQLLTETPAVRRIFASTSPYEPVYKETQDVKEKYKTENFKQTRKIDELSESFYRLKTSGKPAAELAFKRIERYVASQPEVDQDRLIDRFEAGKAFWNIPNRPFWLIVRGAGDPEAKAELIYNRWISLPKAGGDALLAQANSLPGILSDRVEEKFNHLKSVGNKRK
jgi:hypothetical protein